MIIEYGPLKIGFSGGGPIAEIIFQEFSSYRKADGRPDVVFNFTKRLEHEGFFRDEPFVRVGTARFSEKRAFLDRISQWDCFMERGDGAISVYCASSPNLKRRAAGLFPGPVQRFSNMYYKTIDELQALDFMYAIFQPVIELYFLKKGASFIHAGGLQDADGKAVLFAGWGGCGKTSTCSTLILGGPRRWSFLSDDMSVLNKSGHVSYNDMGIHIYPYNLEGAGELNGRVFSKMTGMDRLHWMIRSKVFGREGVVRRHSPKAIYRSTSEGAPLKALIYMDRHNGRELVIEPVTPDEAARRAASVLLFELKLFLPQLLHMGASGSRAFGLPDFGELAASAKGVFIEAFSRSRNYRVSVPVSGMGPSEVAGEIMRKVLD
ncbi:MAG: hypothetical protein H3C68_02225 [Deltaproteobacteria bacterium]|nr:hypothetical protein [Deltaproteobacteria bacterium]MBZ0218927.1 hypothetical protein [Deltaproteobacteria bacterium]